MDLARSVANTIDEEEKQLIKRSLSKGIIKHLLANFLKTV